ncbi:MAG: class I SAM-dependent methyltransferase [Acidilobus sp.]
MTSWELFERLYREYDDWYTWNRVTAENELKVVLRADPGEAWRPCIDVGSGTGFFTAPIGCLGLEPSVNMALIGRLARGVDAVQGRAEAMPIREGHVGSAFMVVTLCFLPSPSEAVAELRRILRPGGKVIACIVPRGSPWAREYERRGREGNPFYSVARFYTVREVVELFSSYGFTLEDALGALTYGPFDGPRPEEPGPYSEGEGFACLRFKSLGHNRGLDEEARKA